MPLSVAAAPAAQSGGNHSNRPAEPELPPHGHSGFLGTPSQGSGIVGCAGGAGCGTACLDSASAFTCRRYSTAGGSSAGGTGRPPYPGFGVVPCWQPQVSSILAGKVASVSTLPLTQLFSECDSGPPKSGL